MYNLHCTCRPFVPTLLPTDTVMQLQGRTKSQPNNHSKFAKVSVETKPAQSVSITLLKRPVIMVSDIVY